MIMMIMQTGQFQAIHSVPIHILGKIELHHYLMVYMVTFYFPLSFFLVKNAQYEASVPENKVGALVVKMSVTDRDELRSPAWNAKFQIVAGDKNGQFAVETGTGKQEGIITTVKVGLNFVVSCTENVLYTILPNTLKCTNIYIYTPIQISSFESPNQNLYLGSGL